MSNVLVLFWDLKMRLLGWKRSLDIVLVLGRG